MRALFERWLGRLAAQWSGLSEGERVRLTALGLIGALYIGHYLAFSVYFIEDAGISFAYALHLAEGEGLVTYPGGERVEGYSNPLWTFLIALLQILRVPAWTAAKLMGGVFGVITLYLVYGITRRCRPGRDDLVDVLPSLFLAASTTFVIWNASGLENCLFNVLLAGGIYRTLVEAERAAPPNEPGFPWSAALFLGLAVTRPEGIVYAAVGGLFRLILALRDRDGDLVGRVVKPIGAWLLVFWGPFLAYHAWRYSYFGWEFPNTYYAKLDGEDRFAPWAWGKKGWLYVRNYVRAYYLSAALPLYAAGLAGLRGRGGALLGVLVAVGGFLFIWEGQGLSEEQMTEDLKTRLDAARVGFLLAATALLAVETAGRRGASARLLVLAQGAAGVFFVIYSGGDWMNQWRWSNLVAAPNFVLLGLGLGAFAEHLPRWRRIGRGAWTGALVGALMIPNIWNTIYSVPEPETTVSDVRRRVDHMRAAQERMHLDHVTLLDVDMGAHMWHTDWGIADIAGLVDVSMARHLYQKKFIQEYLFKERLPEFAHVHKYWANKSKIPSHAEWRRDYIEIPGYPANSREFHVGNHVRKDIFVRRTYEGPPAREVRYREVEIEGWSIPAAQAPVGGRAYVEVWLKMRKRRSKFRLLMALDDGAGNRLVVSIPPGYDWYPTNRWKTNEHVVTRMDFALTDRLPEGTYDVGFVMIDADSGEVMRAERHDGAPPEPRRYMRGAVWFDGGLTIVSAEAALAEAEADREAALALTLTGGERSSACDAAWARWRQARWHVFEDTDWRDEREPEMRSAVAGCYALVAAEADDEADQIEALVAGRRYDHRHDALLEAARPLAAELDTRGDQAAAEEDWRAAYAAWRDALRLDPRLAHTRRKAEAARDERFGIEGKVSDKEQKEREEAAKGDDEATTAGD